MNIDLKAPTKWAELTLDQFRMVAEALLLHLTEQERLFMMLCQLTGIRRYADEEDKFVTEDGQDFRLKDYELADFCNSLRWILTDDPIGVPNPSKVDDYLRDMSFGDWFETDTQFRLYDDDQDRAHFDIILPKLGMAEEPRPVGIVVDTMLKLWWHSVMGLIAPMYPNVFEKSDPGSGAAAIYNPFKQLQDFHLILNEDRPQDNEKIDDARLHDVLSALDSKIEKQKREAEAMRKIKKGGKP